MSHANDRVKKMGMDVPPLEKILSSDENNYGVSLRVNGTFTLFLLYTVTIIIFLELFQF